MGSTRKRRNAERKTALPYSDREEGMGKNSDLVFTRQSRSGIANLRKHNAMFGVAG
jgi:hypothetical protein